MGAPGAAAVEAPTALPATLAVVLTTVLPTETAALPTDTAALPTEAATPTAVPATDTTAPEPRMDVQHVAEAVVMMARLPLETNVQFLTVMATKMPFVGRG